LGADKLPLNQSEIAHIGWDILSLVEFERRERGDIDVVNESSMKEFLPKIQALLFKLQRAQQTPGAARTSARVSGANDTVPAAPSQPT
jgi:hypothetical protein